MDMAGVMLYKLQTVFVARGGKSAEIIVDPVPPRREAPAEMGTGEGDEDGIAEVAVLFRDLV